LNAGFARISTARKKENLFLHLFVIGPMRNAALRATASVVLTAAFTLPARAQDALRTNGVAAG
jgi:hypothetical protein